MYKKYAIGLWACCPLLFSACASVPPSPAPRLITMQCAPVVPCTLTESRPTTNGDLNVLLDQVENDWAVCAAQVDVIYRCQQEAQDAQAR